MTYLLAENNLCLNLNNLKLSLMSSNSGAKQRLQYLFLVWHVTNTSSSALILLQFTRREKTSGKRI